MKEFIEILNKTSEDRVLGYSIVFLIALGTIVNGIVRTVKYCVKK